MSYCPKCGKEVTEDTKFCPNCGNPLSEETFSTEEVVPQENPISETVETVKKKVNKYKMNKWIVIDSIIAVVVLLLLIIIPVTTHAHKDYQLAGGTGDVNIFAV